MTIGNCIKTGAVVHFEEYGQTFAADLFEVGHSIIVQFQQGSFGDASAFNFPRAVTHSVIVGSAGYLSKERGIAVVPKFCIFPVDAG